jgi:outer membrane protein assembly factor BamB
VSRSTGTRPPLRTAWVMSPAERELSGTVLGYRGRLFGGTAGDGHSGSSVFCLDAGSGALQWLEPCAPLWPTFLCTVSPDVVVAATQRGGVALAVQDGRAIWRRDDLLQSATVAVNGAAPMSGASVDGREFVENVRLADGRAHWRAAFDGERGILAVNERIVALWGRSLRGQTLLEALDLSSGARLWSVDWGERRPKPSIAAAGVEAASEVVSAVVAEDRLYVALTLSRIACIRCETGEVHWEVDVPSGQPSSLAVLGDRLYFLSTACLGVIDVDTGALIYWKENALPTMYARGCLFDGTWYVGRRGGLDAFDPLTGTKVWTHELDESLESVFVFEGRLYAAALRGGRIYCFVAQE